MIVDQDVRGMILTALSKVGIFIPKNKNKKLTLDLEVHQRGASWRVCTESGTPEMHLSAGCERIERHCGVPAGPQHPETDKKNLTLSVYLCI